jgi:hypothetical protein
LNGFQHFKFNLDGDFHIFILTEIRKSFVHDLGHCIYIFTNIKLTLKLENTHKLHDSFTFHPLKVMQDFTLFDRITIVINVIKENIVLINEWI